MIQSPAAALDLPAECCDAVLMRVIFHHFADGRDVAAPGRAALQPGGVLAIIDYGEDSPEFGGGHGIAHDQLVDEVQSAGLELVRVIEDWSGKAYCALFRWPDAT